MTARYNLIVGLIKQAHFKKMKCALFSYCLVLSLTAFRNVAVRKVY